VIDGSLSVAIHALPFTPEELERDVRDLVSVMRAVLEA